MSANLVDAHCKLNGLSAHVESITYCGTTQHVGILGLLTVDSASVPASVVLTKPEGGAATVAVERSSEITSNT